MLLSLGDDGEIFAASVSRLSLLRFEGLALVCSRYPASFDWDVVCVEDGDVDPEGRVEEEEGGCCPPAS